MQYLKRSSTDGAKIYALVDKVVRLHHKELEAARIAVAWHDGWSADADDRLKLGTMKKLTALDQQLTGCDAVICLNKVAWAEMGAQQREALIDHELQHLTVDTDRDGEAKEDEAGRTCYRIRKHDMEEFSENIRRYGLWKDDIKQMVLGSLRKRIEPLFAQQDAEKAETVPMAKPKPKKADKPAKSKSDPKPADEPLPAAAAAASG